MTNSITKKIAAAAIGLSAFAGSIALASTATVTITAALTALTATSVEAAVICRDKPIDTRGMVNGKPTKFSRIFKYQPMSKKGLFGKCKENGSIKTIKMLIPKLPAGTIRTGLSRLTRVGDGCSAGPARGKNRFHAACNAHDICYGSLGVSKRKCERMFRKNMKKICKHGPIGCRGAIGTFLAGVNIGAHPHYKRGQIWAAKHYKKN